MNIFHLIKKNKSVFLIFLICFFSLCFSAQAQVAPAPTRVILAPQIFVTDLKITGTDNNKITGEFTVWNYEKYFLPDLNYEVKLFQGTQFESFQLVGLNVLQGTYSVGPNVKVVEPFTYSYPQNIASGDYTIRAQVMTARGDELGWEDQAISLNGSGKFLEITPASPKVLVAGKEYFTQEGVNVDSTEKVTASLEATNPGDKITVTPQIKIFDRQYNMSVVKKYQDSPITFAKGETKTVRLDMPNLATPDSYLAEVSFYIGKNQVSGTEYFRWVVKGVSGKILYAKANKDYFKAGENINLTVDSIGPADGSDIGNGKLDVVVSDKDGKLIGKTSFDVSLNSTFSTSIISVPVKTETISPKIDIKLSKDGKLLDERILNLPVFSAGAKKIKNAQAAKLFYLILSISITVLIIILAIAFFLFKFKSKNK
jgi:hypothetical protein